MGGFWPHAACFSSVDFIANSASGMLPRAECGRRRLLSSFHEVMALRASGGVENSVSLRHQSRKRPLKLSTKTLSGVLFSVPRLDWASGRMRCEHGSVFVVMSAGSLS